MPSARRCDACQDKPSSSIDCDACDRLYNARRLFDRCCETTAANVYRKVTDDTWRHSSSMWELIRNELSTEIPLSQGLIEILGSWVVAQEMSSLQLACICRISGGLAADRHKEAMERAGAFYMTHIAEHGAEKVLFLFDNFDACYDIHWTKICSMTELGNKKPYASGAQIIVLPCAFDETLTTFQASEEELCVTLLPASVGKFSRFTQEGERSLRWILENHARRFCVIQWPPSHDVDASRLPPLPAAIKALKLCGMPKFLNNPVPFPDAPNTCYCHWMHSFVANLQKIEHLTLSDCGYESQDLVNLHRWLPSLKHIQVAANDWIVKGGELLVDSGVDKPPSYIVRFWVLYVLVV